MAIVANMISRLSVDEVFDGAANPFVAADNNSVTHNTLSTTATLDNQSSVPATKQAAFEIALTAGAATIDLRALPGTNGGIVDLNGLKVQIIKLRNKIDNANVMTISEGDSDGYELLGNGWAFDLKPGQEVLLYLREAAPDVGAAAKTIDVAGTGTQVLQVHIVAG